MTESLKDKVATIPINFEIEPVIEYVHTKISLPEELVQKFCKKFGCKKGNLTTAIKSEIKKCIRKNLSFELDKYFSSAKVKAVFCQVTNRVTEKKNSLDTGGERSRLIEKEWMNAFYELAFKDFSNAALECYKSVDRNHGDYNLYHLDCEYIVNKVFITVFGEITVTSNKSVNENQEDDLLKILEYGIPDEELAIIYEKLKEVKSDEE